jgi:hypothetical protein
VSESAPRAQDRQRTSAPCKMHRLSEATKAQTHEAPQTLPIAKTILSLLCGVLMFRACCWCAGCVLVLACLLLRCLVVVVAWVGCWGLCLRGPLVVCVCCVCVVARGLSVVLLGWCACVHFKCETSRMRLCMKCELFICINETNQPTNQPTNQTSKQTNKHTNKLVGMFVHSLLFFLFSLLVPSFLTACAIF